jgi:DNA repair photolyase
MTDSADQTQKPPPPRGRGATLNPVGRFETLDIEIEPDPDDYPVGADGTVQGRQVRTTIYHDTTRTIIARNDSPDVGFEASLNPYRGCEHGCIYCFARPSHEYLGLSAGIDFETKIFAKLDAAKLLRRELAAKSWTPKPIIMSGVTDCYQPVERKLELTRACLKVLAECRNPCAIITKNALVTRDIDVLGELAAHNCVAVNISITTLDGSLARTMEPRASQPHLRLKAVEKLAKAGIPVTVLIGPVLPGLTEHEIPQILERAAGAGATGAGYVMLRLPYGVKDLFQDWLQVHYPDRKDKVIHRVQSMRGGRLNDSAFGVRMRGSGVHAEQIRQMFRLYQKKYGLDGGRGSLSTEFFRRPALDGQMSLF